MSSSTANQSYSNYGSYTNSNSSGGSTYTGGQGTSSGAMMDQWATTRDRTENFYVTGQRTGRGIITTIDTTILKFEKEFNGRR
ncbi:uncharacterized protein FIESC28_05473 [Fusarium coffeatum]|uniref:Uncharacterized protein n=1 Tax=Fusarium coffeatum TaxID=231269 RepID=A0A366RS02_9HYPO|nr:uncharacterized protein FIESC28_05473 [Fusarium coffeatum]RBR19867.1 hypothetical protein FIESC28_05473 [Fusarium coffeatum]